MSLRNASYNDIKDLFDRLKELEDHKLHNALDYVDFTKYVEQTEVIDHILKRVNEHIGPKFTVAFGGNQSGKSEAGAIACAKIFDVPDTRILCATIETKLSINVQQRKLHQYLRDSNIQYGSYNAVRGWKNNVIVGRNRSKILFKTYAQGFESFQGDEYDLVWLDEECSWDIFQEVIMRTVKRDGGILLTFTSLQGFTRLVNFLWDTNNSEVWSTVLDLYMNPYILKSSKDSILRSIDPDEVESRIHGRPHLKEGLIYKEFKEINKIDRFDYMTLAKGDTSRYQIHEGIDPHERTPHHWAKFMYDRNKNILYVVEELKAPIESMIIRDFCKLIKMKRNKFAPQYCQIDTSSMKPDVINVHRDEDQENVHTARMEFYNHGINTILCTKDNALGIDSVKRRLKVIKDKDGNVRGNPTLYVFNDLKGVIHEFGRYSWDSYSSDKLKERKEIMNKPLKKDDHFMDIIKYECLKLKIDYGLEDPTYTQEQTLYDKMGY